MATKIKLDGGAEIELPEGFNNFDEVLAKFNEISTQLPALQQSAALAQKFSKWGNPDDLEARLTAHINQKAEEARQAALAEGATKKQAKQTGDDVNDQLWAQWDTMTPQQQAAALATQVQNSVGAGLETKFKSLIEGYWTEAQKQLAQGSGSTQQQFDLLARALDAKLANPKLDLSKVWGTMSELAKASPEQLMAMAMKQATSEDDKATYLATEKAKWKEETDKAAAAEKLSVLNSNTLNRTFQRNEERPSINKPGGEDAMKRSILEKALSNGDIQPGQI